MGDYSNLFYPTREVSEPHCRGSPAEQVGRSIAAMALVILDSAITHRLLEGRSPRADLN